MFNKRQSFDELINKSPKSIVWVTVTSSFIFLFFLFVILFTISYPDTVEGNGVVTTDPKPVLIYNPRDGIIVDMAADNKEVKKGDIIGRFTDEFSIENLDSLKNFEAQIDRFLLMDEVNPDRLLKYNIDLGKFNTYIFKVKYDLSRLAYQRNVQKRYPPQATILSMKVWNRDQRQVLGNQINKLILELDSLKIVRSNIKGLYNKGTIGKNEGIEIDEEIQKKVKSISELRFSLYNSEIINNSLEKEMENLVISKEEKEEEIILSLKKYLLELHNLIEEWKHNNILIAPVDGRLLYLYPWKDLQYFRKEEKLFAIIDSSNSLVVDAQVRAENFGKVFKGLKTKIISLNYPKGEYGVIYGKVEKVNAMPKDGEYSVSVKLESPIKTSYGRLIPFQPEMPVKIEIITSNKSIASRLMSILNFE